MLFRSIPTTVAPQEDSFLEIVDSLYFLLYEGSGSAKRLTDRVAVDRLEALWLLKHLRLGARHDVDHGSANDAQKKSEQVGAAYCELVGRRSLKTREEFLQAQRALYQRLIDMLESIWFG